ncbi:hypothetical protein EHE19_015020 [Ruminiclostridium herbifermentans]|uniref:Uncharacterized protein n=1 Tax=Ruminiclostridium herbifermentans TaxID=2488810 RepID=A0A7H1VLB6_9FIRM|nr:hypothetical protein EHE19_015020 [Ruminiclostridium herbifermentans]
MANKLVLGRSVYHGSVYYAESAQKSKPVIYPLCGFITFIALGRSWTDYIVVNTLMLGACGVYDLFWWSILGEMFELGKNPDKIMGVGLSANVLGVLLGGLIGNGILGEQSYNPTLLALGIVWLPLSYFHPYIHG